VFLPGGSHYETTREENGIILRLEI
jgi:hypothetical protein